MHYIMDEKDNLTLNLATGSGFSVKEIIDQAKTVTGNDIPYQIVDRRLGDPAELVAKSTLAHEMINWECKYSNINTILESMWNVYNN